MSFEDITGGRLDLSSLPFVFDNSGGLSPAAPLTSSYNRAGLERGVHQDKVEAVPRPSYEQNPSNASQYESERERNSRPHIATQDRSYDLQIGLDIPRISHDSGRESENSGGRVDTSQRKPDYIDPDGFKLGEVPNERKRSVGTLRSPDIEESQDKGSLLSFGSDRTETAQKTISADSIPPRGDSFRSPQPRTDSSTSAKGKSVESQNTSVYSPGRSRHAHGASSSSAVTSESSETRRPSTAQDGAFSPSQLDHSELSPSLPPLTRTLGGLGFDEEIKRVFGGGSNDSILRRVSNSVKHGRSLSEAARQSPKWPRSPSSGPPFGETTAPLSPDGKEDVASLRLELRRSTRRIAELEAKLNVCQNLVSRCLLVIDNCLEQRVCKTAGV
jgi:hypothetical protein